MTLRSQPAPASDRSSPDKAYVARGPMFFVLVPSLIGFVMGVNQVAVARAMAWPVSILFWVGLTLLLWWGLYLVTVLVSRLFAPWQLAIMWVVIAAALIGSVILRPLIWAYVSLFMPLLDDPTLIRPMKPFALDAAFITEHLRNWAALIATWVVANLVSSELFDYPRYRTEPKRLSQPLVPRAQPELAPSSPEFGAKFVLLGGKTYDINAIAAVRAEDHYVRVYATDGSNFILTARFRDTVEALKDFNGCQTHRSWWVNLAYVASVNHDRRDPVLELSNGLAVPVGQSYKQLLRVAGVLRSV